MQYPRLERNSRGEPVWDQGPAGGVQIELFTMGLPDKWPDHWPEPPMSLPEVRWWLFHDELKRESGRQ